MKPEKRWTRSALALWLVADTVAVAMISSFAAVGAAEPQTEDTTPAAPEQRDVLGAALRQLDASRDDLGIHANPAWSRFPHPRHIPYVLPFFEGVFEDPLRLYDLSRTLGNTVERFLAPGAIESEPQALHKLVYYLAIDKRGRGFRDYSANLPDRNASFLQALEAAHGNIELEPRAFGRVARPVRAALRKSIAAMPAGLPEILARLVDGLVDAERWRQTAMRNVVPEHQAACWKSLDVARSPELYHPEFDDVARTIDASSLDYACMKTVQAAQDARRALVTWHAALPKSARQGLGELQFEHRTPLGWIVVGGSRDDLHVRDDVFVLIELGGDDTYEGGAGASTPEAPISVCIDLNGKDRWISGDAAPTQGAGIFGAGVLIDVAGDDTYEAESFAQGAGIFGLGLLVDEDGRDRYVVQHSGQGFGVFGSGLCFDVQGNDAYGIHELGQGYGGVGGGVGVLADHSGRDHYMAEPYVSAGGSVRASYAQGVGRGRRGDGADGHCWAGGLGALVDVRGNDTYESGNWSLGAGYWFGTGALFDGAGDDIYRSVYFTQAAAAHYANGVLVDEAGNDQHVLFETAGAAFGFGWDYANALMVDKAGNDRYEALVTSFARADIRSTALFIELGGDDRYQLGKEQQGLGAADWLENYATPDPMAPYNSEAKSFGVFLEVGGTDEYRAWDSERRTAVASETWGNDRDWQSPAPTSDQHGFANHGLGLDVPAGTVPELMRFDTGSQPKAP